MASIYYNKHRKKWDVAASVPPDGGTKRWSFSTEEEARRFANESGLEILRRGRRRRTLKEVQEYILQSTVAHDDGCWVWQRTMATDGYGGLNWRRESDRKTVYLAHRVSYTAFVGDIPEGLQIDHLCRNRACVNPEHLEAVTPMQNVWASGLTLAGINGTKTHCPQGHIYDESNTYLTGPRKTWRMCRTCLKAHSAAAYARRKATA